MKGPFRSPLDEEAALLFAVKKFLSKKGIALVEVIVALALLAMILILAATVKFTLLNRDLERTAELSASALMRRATMSFQAGNLVDDDGNVTNTIENGGDWEVRTESGGSLSNVIYGTAENGESYTMSIYTATNDVLGLKRLSLDVVIENSAGVRRASLFGNRFQRLPFSRTNIVPPPPPSMSIASSVQQLNVYTTNALGGVVVISSQLSGTNVSTNLPYGSTVTMEAKPNVGFTFVGWAGDTASLNTNAPNSYSKPAVTLDDDKKIEAKFH